MKLKRYSLGFLFLLSLVCWGQAEASPLKDAVESKLKSLRATGYTIYDVSDATVMRLIPTHPLVVVRFRQYPVGVPVPEGLKEMNIFFEQRDGSLGDITRSHELEAFFLTNLPLATDDPTKIESVKGWLILSGELKQDGFYGFEIQEPITVISRTDKTEARGKFIVNRGGRGEVIATLVFNNGGRLLAVSEVAKLKPGVRPICQATKLLDPDPIVRRMAEQDLIVMGTTVKPYLDYIRPRLSAPLKQAADRVWKKIVQEDQ